MAVAIRIARVSQAAGTGGQVIGDTAVGVGATGAGTGIAALLLLTGLVGGTVGVADALGTTRLIRIAKVIGQALAGTNAVPLTADSVRAAGIGFAGGHLLIDNAL